ncbi:hypothetical protein NPIL_523981 [Nephila pilipes]|uniref:Uncharacterized protein n=1 Tax=Nephila pilipes TaxID=299642 RepID=A0A8X6TQ75_NEPPI|nr:hypothetical protein NPIL_523981 [Nephila pilipes]
MVVKSVNNSRKDWLVNRRLQFLANAPREQFSASALYERSKRSNHSNAEALSTKPRPDSCKQCLNVERCSDSDMTD